MNFKQRMLLVISLLIILGFSISAISSFKIAQQQALTSLIQQEIPLTLDNVYSEVQTDLLKPQLVSSLMANDTFVHDWIAAGELDIDSIARYLAKLKDHYGLFTTFFVSQRSSRYFYAGGILKTISEENPVDAWYYRFREKQAESEVNIDPDLSNNNHIAIFINVKVRDQQNKLAGIIGVGLNISSVAQQLDSYYKRYGKTVYFINRQGDVVLSGNHGPKEKNINEKEGMKEIASEILADNEGHFSYTYQDKKQLLSTRYVEELDLLLCVEAETGQISLVLIKSFIINIVVSFFLLLAIFYLIVKILNRYQKKLEKAAWWDHLTGLLNRSSFTLRYQQERSRHYRNKSDMVLLMIDIDFFKHVNDSKGHLQGDKVLQLCAHILKETLRPSDIIARWGGEEFVVLLPETHKVEAIQIAERLRLLVQNNSKMNHLTGTGLTISIGLSLFDATQDMDWHISMADTHLYKAKENGRNCVVYS